MLLRRYRPLLVYDLQEEHHALAAESSVENEGNTLVRGKETLAEAGAEAEAALTLDLLASMAESGEAEEDDHLAEMSTARAIWRTQDTEKYPPRVYGRVTAPDGDFVWLQYWLWFYFRLGNLFGWGQQEGGWELFQVGLGRENLTPRVLTAKQSGEAERAEWEQVAKWECEAGEDEDSCAHPVVGIELFTHAVELAPAAAWVAGPEAGRERCLPDVALLGGWSEWPGRWGATKLGRGSGRSPRSPAHQTQGWKQPARFHRKARRLKQGARPRIRFALPPKPEIEDAYLLGTEAVVQVSCPPAKLHRPRWLFVTVHETGRDRVIRKRTARARKDSTCLRIPLLEAPEADVFVCVSSYDWRRQRSEVVESEMLPKSPAAPALSPPEWSGSVMKRFHHDLIRYLDKHGALTVAELKQREPRVLDLMLNAREVEFVVESARRHGLVEPLNHGKRVDSSTVDEAEWTLTERGRARIGGPIQLVFGALKLLPVALIVPVVSLLLKDVDWPKAVAGGLGVLFLLTLVVLTIHRRSQGAFSRTVASVWDRHAVELPALNRWYRRPARIALYVLGGLFILALGAGAALSSLLTDGEFLAGIAFPVLYSFVFLIIGDLARVGVLKREAANTRDGD